MEALKKWKNFVMLLREDRLTKADGIDLAFYLDVRNELEEAALSDNDKSELQLIDEEFKKIGQEKIKKCGLLDEYNYYAADEPINYWWWHMEEE